MDDSLRRQRLWNAHHSDSMGKSYTSMTESSQSPDKPLPEIQEIKYPSIFARLKSRYTTTDKFIKSKGALLIMALVLFLGFLFWGDHLYTSTAIVHFAELDYYPLVYILSGLPLCFYPLAGMLADNKYGRYETISGSLYILLVTTTICALTSAIAGPLFHIYHVHEYYSFIMSCAFFLLASPGSIGFYANHLPFGLDQLYESPVDHQSLFIHWLIWIDQLAILINSISWSLYIVRPTHLIGISTKVSLPVIVTVVLGILLVVLRKKKNWFLRDTAHVNPYRLVYQVTKFSKKHKAPLNRSAFTFCEEGIPKGLDLGKEKYGGPFTTDAVENVKAFYGILKILFCIGPFFFIDIAANGQLYFFSKHTTANFIGTEKDENITTYLQEYLIQDGLMTPLLIVICLPVYICLLRPFALPYRPGMLKRLGFAIFLKLLSICLTLAMDIYYHITETQDVNERQCMFDLPNTTFHKEEEHYKQVPFLDLKVLIVQRTLAALAYVIYQIAVFEFICSQSPRSMVGMLVGLGYSIRGINSVLGSVIIIPLNFLSKWLLGYCGYLYYALNLVVGIITIVSFCYLAKRYQYRARDEFCDYHRYAENYFSHRPNKKSAAKNSARTKWYYSFVPMSK